MRVVDHAQLFHHAPGAVVGRNGERDEAGEFQHLEGVFNDGASALGRQAATPEVESNTPSDFDCRHEMCLEGWNVQANVADKCSAFAEFRSVKPKAEPVKVVLNADHGGVRFFRCERGWVKLHHARVCIESPKGLTVCFAPGA